MLIHGSELVAVAQGLVEYWDSRWIFSALRYELKNPKHDSARGMSRRLQRNSWAQVRATQPAAVKCSLVFPTSVLPQPRTSSFSFTVSVLSIARVWVTGHGL